MSQGFGSTVQVFTKSSQHFSDLGERLVKCGNCVDLYACSLDQVTLHMHFIKVLIDCAKSVIS